MVTPAGYRSNVTFDSDCVCVKGSLMYQQYPGGPGSAEPAAGPVSAPQSVIQAARVMYVGVAASVVGIVIDLLMRHTIQTAIIQHRGKMTTSQVNTAYHAELAVLVIFGLIGAGLWLWMARSCLAGKSWARVTSTVFFGIDTLFVLIGAAAVRGGGLTRLYGIIVWVIGLIAIILLWRRSSSDYFRGAPRY
jgi:hypothetical protein